MGDDDLACAIRGDDGICSYVGDDFMKRVAVIGFVGEYGLTGLTFEQRGCLDDLACLPGCDDQTQRPAQRIGQQMDFGR